MPSSDLKEKTSAVAIARPATASMMAMLALRQHRLNQVVGIQRITPQVLAYLGCYVRAMRQEAESELRAETFSLFWASFLNTTIQEARGNIKALLKEAEASTGDPARVRELAGQIDRLNQTMLAAKARLDQIGGS